MVEKKPRIKVFKEVDLTVVTTPEEKKQDEYEFVSEDDMIVYFKKRKKEVVEREDLQYLIQLIDDEDLDYMDFVKRIKEKYKISGEGLK